MVSVTLDYKTTHAKSKCKICNKLIEKGQKRVLLDNDNSYQREYRYYHLNCFYKVLTEFKEHKWEKVIN